MTVANGIRHDEQIAALAENYRANGYEVVVEPKSAEIPFSLGGYHPDLLVRKGSQGILVEVKSRADRLSFDTLHSVVEEVRRHPGWRFVLVTPQDIPGDGLPGEGEETFSWKEIEMRIDRAHRLIQSGETEAAYLGLWIAFELLLRLQVHRIALPVERLAPSIMTRQLYSLGEISAEQFDVALESLAIRNRVAHGYATPDLGAAVEKLSILVSELLEAWKAEATAN